MIDGRNFFQSIKVDVKTYENIRQIATGPVVDYKTYCLLCIHIYIYIKIYIYYI